MTTCEIQTAVKNVVVIPTINVIANPLTAPCPKRYNIRAVRNVVMFESKIVQKERLKPKSIASRRRLPALSSSRMRSQIITLASTAIPMVRTIPAIPGKVKAASSWASMPNTKNMLKIRDRLATAPPFPQYPTIKTTTNAKPQTTENNP